MFSREFLLAATSFFFAVSLFMVQPIIPVYLYKDLETSEQLVGVITALMAFSSVFLRIPCALCARGRRVLAAMIAGLSLNAFSLLGYGLSWDPYVFAVFRVIHGVALALNYTLLLSIASMISGQDNLEESVTGYSISLALGLWIGPASGVLLRGVIGLRQLMFAASGLASISILSGLALSIGLRGSCSTTVSDSGDIKSFLKPANVYLGLTYLSFMFAFGALSAYAPLKAKLDFGLSDQLIILLFTGYYFIVFLARVFLLKARGLRESIGSLRLLSVSLVSGVVGMVLLGLSGDVILFMLSFSLTGFAHGTVFPLTAALVARETPHGLRVIGNSVYLTSADLGNLLGPVFVSGLLGFTSLSFSLSAASIAPALGLLMVRKLRGLGLR
ncbi:MAG: MFS transporter [Thaumarchaeota archaeon]|nr:MFS transporter [Nitrososphaerota archaeon]